MNSKIKKIEEIAEISADLRQKGKKIVTTNGAFDLFHAGHLKSLAFAKSKGDILIVLLNTDRSIKKYKSSARPIIPEQEREQIVAAIEYVDYVCLFDEETPIACLEKIRPDIHVKGSEYRQKIVEKETVEKYNGKIVFIQREDEDTSTTKIIKKIQGLR